MVKEKPLVVVTRKLPDAVETRMMELFDVRLNLRDEPFSSAQLKEAMSTADVLVATVTDRIDKQLIGASGERLKLLPPHAYIVNTARGEIIDEAALVRILRNRDIAGAALDVFENEPALNPKLLQLDNVVLLPHMASATVEGRNAMGESVIINIKSFVDGHKPPNRVFPETLGF